MGKAKKIVIHEYCKGCTLCIHVCKNNVLTLSDNHTEFGSRFPCVSSLESCIVCRLCELHCPDFAIDIYAEGED